MLPVQQHDPRARRALRASHLLLALCTAAAILLTPASAWAMGSAVTQGATTPAHHATSTKLSTPAIAIAILAALIALACVAWAAARLTAYEPRWARSARHALAEGGFRASATWAEFTDWLKLGR